MAKCKLCGKIFEYKKGKKFCSTKCQQKDYRLNNKKRLKKYHSDYYKDNKDVLDIKNSEWRKNNPYYMTNYNKKYYKENEEKIKTQTSKWSKDNKERSNYLKNLSRKNRYKNNYLFRIEVRLRNRIRKAMVSNNFKKDKSLRNILGCDLKFLSKYLDETFKNNYGRDYTDNDVIHIDHIIPLSKAKSKSELYALNHYTNLQYLLVQDNLIKGAK